MTKFVVNLSYDKERTMNDGRRASPTSQRAWMEPVYTQVRQTKILLCSQVETEPGIHLFGNRFVKNHARGRTQENRSRLEADKIKAASGWRQLKNVVAHILPNVFQALGKMLDSRYLYIHYIRTGAPKATVLCKMASGGGWRCIHE